MRKRFHAEGLRCSFCRKAQEAVGQLISSPAEYPRSYICDECIAVCHCILEDDKRDSEPETKDPATTGQFAQHPLALELIVAIERWAVRDLQGLPASEELDRVRAVAAILLAEPVKPGEEDGSARE